MTPQEVYDWKHHPVTMEVFEELRNRISGLEQEIVGGILSDDEKLLAFKAGAVQAFRDVLEVDI